MYQPTVNDLTVNDSTAQVVLHRKSVMGVFDLLSSPQVVVLILTQKAHLVKEMRFNAIIPSLVWSA